MSEIEQPTTAQPADLKARLLDIFTRLLPLVDSVSDKIRFASLLGIGLIGWVFVWLYFLKQVSLSSSLIVAGVALLPILILLRFWWALEELKDLPNIAGRMVEDTKGEIRATVQGIKTGNTPRLGFIRSAKSLWSIGSLAGEARELLGSYLSIGTLVNPFSLVLGVLSLLFVLLLVLVGVVLLVLAFF
ncbi:hypothetical protein [Thiothrix nivea]|uniref:Uncharacterized protein n=1 Tax=Thiothrix nivea (strain ATCC 35100 / DSM 5205 / JP2) TaxID=870187 RepID=A0A656HG13_THINJ|nr:hypothetical protein [Thiothrix nivea]EIJ35333.1 hypothetical protein Thini_2796 [Thiothrix nivea DSM 5205]